MENKIKFSPGCFFMAALWLLLLPIRWATGALLAALMHELFHCLTIILCGGEIHAVSFGINGAKIETSAMSSGKEAFCTLAGPAGSFLILLLAEYFPEAAICALIQGLYNLMPIFPLDGGRFLRCVFSKSVCTGIELFTLTLLSGLCLLIFFYSSEMAMLLLLFLWIPVIRRKFSCKETKLAVQ